MGDKQVLKLKNSKVHNMHFQKLNNAGEKFLTESGVYKLISSDGVTNRYALILTESVGLISAWTQVLPSSSFVCQVNQWSPRFRGSILDPPLSDRQIPVLGTCYIEHQKWKKPRIIDFWTNTSKSTDNRLLNNRTWKYAGKNSRTLFISSTDRVCRKTRCTGIFPLIGVLCFTIAL